MSKRIKVKTTRVGPPLSSFNIDKMRLDEEWVNHPRQFGIFARETADARAELDEQKRKLELLKAELDKDIRDRPGRYDIKKVTEKVVESAIILDSDYQEQLKRVNKAAHKVGILAAAVSTMEHRRKALENTVQLLLADFYSAPKAKGADREQIEEMEKRTLKRRGKRRRHDG